MTARVPLAGRLVLKRWVGALAAAAFAGTFIECGSGNESLPVQCEGEGVWQDPETGLCWQEPPASSAFELQTWEHAKQYCDNKVLGGSDLPQFGYDDWRLPNIQELMSLIRGCDQSDCGVNDPGCLESSCYNNCNISCPMNSGPADAGCYWATGLTGACWDYWSSSSGLPSDLSWAWMVGFHVGSPLFGDKISSYHVRCVRGGN